LTVRLDPQFRWALYAAGGVLFVTGAAWLLADAWKESADVWHDIAANLLMLHGGAAMIALMLLGALVPLHLRRGWRAKKNRLTGTVMATVNAVLIVTAFGLYYLGSETARPWISRIHYGVGFALPILGLVHILSGRRSVAEDRERAEAERVG
jgi:hypothetical protein